MAVILAAKRKGVPKIWLAKRWLKIAATPQFPPPQLVRELQWQNLPPEYFFLHILYFSAMESFPSEYIHVEWQGSDASDIHRGIQKLQCG